MALVAAAVAVHASPTISYFGAPQSSPQAIANLDRAVNATLRVRSLTMRQDGTSTVYQAPNLTELHFGPTVEITIGGQSFSPNRYGPSSAKWFEVLPGLSLSTSPLDRLKAMLTLPDVQQHGATFVSSSPVAGGTVRSGIPGLGAFREVIRVKNGFVSSQTYALVGATRHPPKPRKCKNCTYFSEFGSANTTSFVDINTSPAIAIPPKAERVIPKVVSVRRLHGALLKIYEWTTASPSQSSAGYVLWNRSGRIIGGGSGSIGALAAPVRYALEENGSGGGGPGSWMDYTVSIGSEKISLVQITRGRTILDSMTAVGAGSNRFVVLVIKTPSFKDVVIEGLSSSGKVLVSQPLSALQ